MASEELIIHGSIELDSSKADATIQQIERRPVKVQADFGATGHVANPGTGFNPRPVNYAVSGGPSGDYDPGRGGGGADGGVRSAVARRADSERKVATANDRLARATERRAANVESGRAGDAGGRGTAGDAGAGGGDDGEDGVGGGGVQRRGRPSIFGIPLGQLGRIGTAGAIARAAIGAVDATMTLNREERLAIGDRGGEDSLRKLNAITRYADKVESLVPIGSEAGGLIREAGYGRAMVGPIGSKIMEKLGYPISDGGDREYAQGTVEAAERQEKDADRRTRLGERAAAARERERGSANGRYVEFGAGPEQQSLRKLEVERDNAMRDARLNHETVSRAAKPGDVPKLDLDYDRVTKSIDAAFELGVKRMRTHDAGEVAGYELTASIYRRRGQQDSRGELEARQDLRRQQAFADSEVGTPGALAKRVAKMALLEAQDSSENLAFYRERGFRTRGLQDEAAVSRLDADRKPLSGEAESIYRKGTTAADRARPDNPGDARLELEITRNQLQTFKNELERGGGSAIEAQPGAYGPGGTEGSGQQGKDYGEAIARCEALLRTINDSLKGE